MKIKKIIKKVLRRVCGVKTYTAHSEYNIFTSIEKKLDGKVALVTGGSGELGRAISFKLASEGAKVFIGGRKVDSINKVVSELKDLELQAFPCIIDVTNSESIEHAFDNIITNDDHIDILVNCAGGSTRGDNAKLYEQSINVIDNMINTNLRGSMLCSREACRYMSKQKSGKIINISSIIGLRGKPQFTDYASSKAGVIGYTSSLATEMGEYGVNVNCVSPGFIQRGVYTEEKLPYLLNSNYLRRIGKPEDIANAVFFLASNESDFITGQNLCVDGGRSLGLYGDN